MHDILLELPPRRIIEFLESIGPTFGVNPLFEGIGCPGLVGGGEGDEGSVWVGWG